MEYFFSPLESETKEQQYRRGGELGSMRSCRSAKRLRRPVGRHDELDAQMNESPRADDREEWEIIKENKKKGLVITVGPNVFCTRFETGGWLMWSEERRRTKRLKEEKQDLQRSTALCRIKKEHTTHTVFGLKKKRKRQTPKIAKKDIRFPNVFHGVSSHGSFIPRFFESIESTRAAPH